MNLDVPKGLTHEEFEQWAWQPLNTLREHVRETATAGDWLLSGRLTVIALAVAGPFTLRCATCKRRVPSFCGWCVNVRLPGVEKLARAERAAQQTREKLATRNQ